MDFAEKLKQFSKQRDSTAASGASTSFTFNQSSPIPAPLNMSNKRKRSDTPPPHPSTLPQFKWPAPLSTKPSFLGIGAQKAGTTWLHDALASHPKFFLPPIKEVHYFNRHHKRSNISWYANHFGRATPTQTIGEITPCYSALSLVEISRIYQTLGPNCKIIFLARNIIERSYSAALMELRNNVNGLEPSCFTKESDYKNLTDCHPDRFDDAYFMGRFDHVDFVGRSDYATTLKNYISVFGKDNLFVGNFEDIKLRPVELLAEIVEFLGGEKGGGGGEGTEHASRTSFLSPHHPTLWVQGSLWRSLPVEPSD